MPNSTMKASSTGLYYPAVEGSDALTNQDSPLQAYLEMTIEGIEDYARREPWAFATWVFGVGFVLGWKLKPW